MVGLIGGLLLALGGGLAMVIWWGGRRPVTDDTLVAELLGPPSARPPRAAPRVREDGAPLSARAAPPVQEDAAPLPARAAEPPQAGDWLDTQLAWITAWAQQRREQIASAAAGPVTGGDRTTPTGGPARRDTGQPAAPVAGTGRRIGHGSPGPSRAATRRCIATTVQGSRCTLPAEPTDLTCAIHAKRAHP